MKGGAEFLSESERGFVFEAIGYLVNVAPISGKQFYYGVRRPKKG